MPNSNNISYNAHAYLADGLLVVQWINDDKSGILLMIAEDGESELVLKGIDDNYCDAPTIYFNVVNGWPKELLKHDVDEGDE